MERMAFRAQTIVADVIIAAGAFALAYIVAPSGFPSLAPSGLPSLSFVQLVLLYAALAAGFSLLFRRELSPWRYTSIPDALVLARIALLTVGVFLLWVFIVDRARGLPRSTLFMAPLFQMVGSMGVRILRRALHEHALDSFAPLKTITDRVTQSPSLLLIGPAALADTYLRDVARSHDRTYTPVGIVGADPRDVGQQVRGVCIIESLENLDAALADLRRAGAELVELEYEAPDAMGEAEFAVLLYELRRDLNAYLAASLAPIPARTLAEVIEFNRAHSGEELRWFGQDLFEMAETNTDEDAYRKARAESLRLAGPEGIDKLISDHSLDVLVAPTVGPAWTTDLVNGDNYNGSIGAGSLAAVAGYPHLTVPMGAVEGLPVGLSFMADKWADHRVLQAGAAYERARSAELREPSFERWEPAPRD